MATPMTWAQLVRAQPALAALLGEIQQIRDPGGASFCANHVWYNEGYRDRLYQLVGWEAPADAPAFLRTSEAFDVAYDTLYHALPNCRNCTCA